MNVCDQMAWNAVTLDHEIKSRGPQLYRLAMCGHVKSLNSDIVTPDKEGGSQECPNCGACKESVEHVLFECASYDSQRLDFFNYLKMVLPPDAFKAFLHGSIFF